MSLFTATSFWNIQPVAIAGDTFQFRNDPYSASLVLALPMSQFSTLGMTSYKQDVSSLIRGNGVNLPMNETGSIGAIYTSSSLVSSGSYDFAAQGYQTSMAINQGDRMPGVVPTASFWISGSAASQNWVIETWIRPFGAFGGTQGSPSAPFHLFFFGEPSTDYLNMTYSWGPTNRKFNYYTRASDTSWNTTTPNVIPALSQTVWYHVAFVRSGASVSVYLNGNRIGYDTDRGPQINIPDGYWRLLNTAAGNSNDGFAKVIQDFRIYNGTDKGYTGTTITVPNSIVQKVS